ncbi:heterokaryon incompatibility protein-domain-containing protein [Cadophora sp. MPI-SDFR-AT-0126]|nr:heterokaryon incompatibility protein-domain-containing protein [Leotiomycetes sp. MPI-SDFR-AT-0126]
MAARNELPILSHGSTAADAQGFEVQRSNPTNKQRFGSPHQRRDTKWIRELHTCKKCENVTIRETDITEAAFKVTLSHSISHAEESSGTCLFYRYLLTLFDTRSHQPEDELNVRFASGSLNSLRFTEGTRGQALRIYAIDKDSFVSKILPTAEIHVDVQSRRAFTQVKSWIDECHSSHRFCGVARSGFVPTRLLDVGMRDEAVTRLVELESKVGIKWASLSYVWGGPQEVRTTKNTLSEHLTSIQVASLPQTLIDAIKVCRQLEIPFLWIDALCIVQDDPEDLFRELKSMASIYQHSYLTISAACAKRVQDGFLGKIVYSYDDFPPTQVRYESRSGETGYVLVCQDGHNRVLRGDSIRTRAWTFQEDLLSPRLLRYSTDFMGWFCRSACKYDGKWKGRDRLYMTDSYDWNCGDVPCVSGRPMPAWEPIVASYSRRAMTDRSDRLTALSAIAEVFAESHNHTYLAGLWRESLPLGLCWMVEQGLREPREKKFRAPSWSWASIDTPVRYAGGWWITDSEIQDKNYGKGLLIGVTTVVDGAEVVDAEVIPTSPGTQYFSIKSASLTMTGSMMLVQWDLDFRDGLGEISAVDFTATGYSDAWENNWPDKETVLSYVESFESKSQDNFECDNASSVSSGVAYGSFLVFAFIIGKSRHFDHGFLGLEPDETISSPDARFSRFGILLTKEGECYRRLGFFEGFVDKDTYDCHPSNLPGFEVQTISII